MRIEIADDDLQDRNECARIAARVLKIASNARPQALGLADVNDSAFLVLEEVDARLRRKAV